MFKPLICVAALAMFMAASTHASNETQWLLQAERDWGDLPAGARDTPIPQDTGYLSREVASGVFVVTDGLYQAMFVVGNDSVMVVDAPPSLRATLPAAIRAATPKPVTHFIYTHSHIDHVGAADLFPNAQRIASAEVAAKLVRQRDPSRPAATRVVNGPSETLTIDGIRIRLDDHGNHHEPGNLYVYLPDRKVLMTVDIVYPGWVPFTHLGMAEDVQGFIDAHDTILGYDFDVFVGGHLDRVGTRSDVETAKAYMSDLIAAAQEGQRSVEFGKIAAETGFANRWLLVKTYMDRVADACSARMIPKWRVILGGTQVSTPGHCWIMQEHLNINGLPAAAQP